MSLCPLCNSEDVKKINTYTSPGYDIYHCVSCDIMFANPMKSVGKEWYESCEWYSISSETLDELRWYEKVFLEDFAVYKDKKVLNIGCGKTLFLKKLKESGCYITAVDINKILIEFTHNILGIEDSFADDIMRFINNYKGKKFDIIIFFEVLEHLENPQKYIVSLKNILSENGIIVFSVPNRERFLPFLHEADYPPHHLTRWNTKSIKNFLQINGYLIENIIISPLTAEVLLSICRIYFGTKILEDKIKKGNNCILINISFKLLFKFRVIFYNIIAMIIKIFIKTKGVSLYTVAKAKGI